MMTEPGFSVTATRPVVASHIFAGREGRAVWLRAGQDIMPVRCVTAAGNPSASLVEHRHDSKAMAHAMEFVDIVTDKGALSVMPWARADAVARIHFGSQVLTERVGSGQTTQISSLARAVACDEESYRSRLRTLR